MTEDETMNRSDTQKPSNGSLEETRTNRQRPVHEIRLGRIRASIWENVRENGARYNVTFARLYKDDDGWKTTASFGRDDLPVVEKVADLAFWWIHQQRATEGQPGDEQNQ
jgi:hypothetical protein